MFHAWHIIRGRPPAFTGFTVAVICGDVGAYRGRSHPLGGKNALRAYAHPGDGRGFEALVRYYGAYSNRARGQRRKAEAQLGAHASS